MKKLALSALAYSLPAEAFTVAGGGPCGPSCLAGHR